MTYHWNIAATPEQDAVDDWADDLVEAPEIRDPTIVQAMITTITPWNVWLRVGQSTLRSSAYDSRTN